MWHSQAFAMHSTPLTLFIEAMDVSSVARLAKKEWAPRTERLPIYFDATMVTRVHNPFKSGTLDGELDADGDGKISQEEWEAEWASRGDLAAAVTRKTDKHHLAVDYPGATVKNKLGPRSPHVLNTPFTAFKLNDEAGATAPLYGDPNAVPKTAAQLFEEELAVREAQGK